MKKKFIAVYALIGVLALGSTTLTSCVDDNESASVTAVRDAKAAQLNALAAEANANAKVKEALAALRQAEADAQTIENEYQQQEYAARLEKLQAEYAAAVAQSQKRQATNEELLQNKLYTTYTAAQSKATSLSNEIAEKTVEIAKLQAGLEGAEKYAAKMIQEYRLDSLEAEAEKAAYVALGENDYEALSQQFKSLTVQIAEQERVLDAKENATTAAEDAFDDAITKIYGDLNPTGDEPVISITLATAQAIQNLEEAEKSDGYLYNWASVSSPAMSVLTSETESVDETITTSPTYDVYSLNEANVLRATEYLKDQIQLAEDELGESDDPTAVLSTNSGALVIWTDTNNNGVQDPGETTTTMSAYSVYNYYKKAYDDAVDRWEAATEDAKATAESAMNVAKANMLTYEKGGLQDALNAVDEAKANLEDFNTQVAAFSGDAKTAYDAAIKAAVDTEGKAWINAYNAENPEKAKLAELNGQKNAVENLIGQDANDDGEIDTPNSGTTVNIQDLIAQCDIDIAKATKNMEEAALLLKDADGNNIDTNPNATAQSVIDKAKAELADLEAELAVVQEGAAYWKEQLEAALNGETAAPAPETPSEGEETPAA